MTNSKTDELLKRSLVELTQLRAALKKAELAASGPIAIVGMACRCPGSVAEPEAFWRLLEEGRDAVGPFPERWNTAALYDPDPDALGKTYVREGGFLDDVELFDAGFFGIAPSEALGMDPQQRIVLEVAWEALERAGIAPVQLAGSSTGVYVGSVGSDYGSGATLAALDGHFGTGVSPSVLSGRLSYVLGLEGPAMTVDTACSSSLVALHLACAALRQGECELALAGGVQVLSTPASFVEFSRLRGLSRDGRCRPFSSAADGTGWSEGCAVLVLKRLADAERDGDRIWAVLRGSAVNQDGRSAGLTAPSGPSQQRVIRRALAVSGLAPTDIDAVEAHGTGTPLGDPVEAAALAAVFAPTRAGHEPVYLGSSKSNFGHAQAAAGVLGVVKMVLALEHEQLPKTLHAEQPSSHIEWQSSGLSLLQEARPWRRQSGRVRRAGVSSFGFSGTNAHVILEEAPAAAAVAASTVSSHAEPRASILSSRAEPRASILSSRAEPRASTPASGLMPLLVSGRSEQAVRAQAERWARWLEAHPGVDWSQLVRTAALERSHFECRAALLASRPDEAQRALVALAAGTPHASVIQGTASSGALAMLFAGQGSQRPGMGRELYGAPGFEAFSQAFDAVDQACAAYLGRSLKEVMWADARGPARQPSGVEARSPAREKDDVEGSSRDGSLLSATRYTQPALFALEVALYRQWQAWGVKPLVLLGHSVGELACAHVAEVMSLADAAALVCARGRLMEQLATPGGAMASLSASVEEVEAWLSDGEGLGEQLDIAGLNTPRQTVVSGAGAAVQTLVEKVRSEGRKATELTVSHAFHSAHMDGMLAAFRQVAESIRYQPPKLAVVSNVTGKRADAEQGDLVTADYWVRHVRQAVRFSEGVRSVLDTGASVLLECGPQGVLCALAAECAVEARGSAREHDTQGELPGLVASLHKSQPEPQAMRAALAAVHVLGQPVAWETLAGSAGRVELPTYAFQRQPYWHRIGTSGEELVRDAWRAEEFASRTDTRASAEQASVVGTSSGAASALRNSLASLPEAQRFDVVLGLVRSVAAAALGLADANELLADRPLKELGLDSLLAIKLRNTLAAQAEVELPATLVFDYPTAASIAALLLARVFDRQASVRSVVITRRDWLDEPIAIVGMACRAPGDVTSPDEYWSLLAEGRDVVGPFPARWDNEALYDPDPDVLGKTYVREGGFLRDVDQFDAGFFGIAPREATAMDPQQRLLLEVSWEALERAGIRPAELTGSKTGVYVGSVGADYVTGATLEAFDGHLVTGQAASVASGRIAYTLGLEGPALTVDTACSSSLVAIHLGCAALHQGDCDLALAGGVYVMSTPISFVEFSRLRANSQDGRCKSFSNAADGTGWAEGCGMVVLKRLSAAQRDGDPVRAVLRGSAINQDGRSQGLTAPNGPSQQAVIRQALAASRLTPDAIDAVEAHGTGTPLGDPIEAGALAAVFGPTRADREPVYLGSSKSNLGHAQSAAGVLGLIKMVLALEHEQLPRTLHAELASEHIQWEGSGLSLLSEPRPWPRRDDRVRRAGVSSFGMSGTNAHLIVEEAPAAACSGSGTAVVGARASARAQNEDVPGLLAASSGREGAGLPLVLSGRSEAALRAQAARWASWLAAQSSASFSDVVRTALLERTHFETRAALFVDDAEQAIAALSALAADQPRADVILGQARALGGVAFVFPGQGSQWPAMGRALWEQSQVFREAVQACDAALLPHTGWSVSDVLRGESALEAADTRVDVIQPALFAMGVALSAVWRSLGLSPHAVVGTSQGEVAAAVVSGALSLEDGARVIAWRSKLLRPLAGTGGMALVERPLEEVRSFLVEAAGALSIAGVNTAGSTIVAGDSDAIDAFVARRALEGGFCRRIDVDYASHSHHMDGLLGELEERLQDLSPRSSDVPMVSTLTGELLDGRELDASYWCRNLREPFRLDLGLGALNARQQNVFVEVSAHPVLALPLTAACADGTGAVASTLSRGADDLRAFYRTLGALHVQGARIAWESVEARASEREQNVEARGSSRTQKRVARRGRAELPTYAFQRQAYWLTLPSAGADLASLGVSPAEHPILRAATPLADGEGVLFGGRISAARPAWVPDHQVFDTVLFPGTGLLDLALLAGAELGVPHVVELMLTAPLALPDRAGRRLQLHVEAADAAGQRPFRIYSRPDDEPGEAPWQLHVTGLLATAVEARDSAREQELDARGSAHEQELDARGFAREQHDDEPSAELAEWPPAAAKAVDISALYARFAAQGLAYGPHFQGLRAAFQAGDTLFGEVSLPQVEARGSARARSEDAASDYGIHPALLDAALHLLAVAPGELSTTAVLLPYAWSGVTLHARGARTLRVRIEIASAADDQLTASLRAFDEAGLPVLTVAALQLRRATAELVRSAVQTDVRDLYRFAFQHTLLAAARVEAHDSARGQNSERTLVLGGQGALSDVLGAPCLADARALVASLDAGQAAPARLLLDKTSWRFGADTAGSTPSEGGLYGSRTDARASVEAGRSAARECDTDAAPSLALRVHETTSYALAELQQLLSEPRLTHTAFVWITGGAVSAGPGDGVSDLDHAALWGLVRSARAENPDRVIRLIDMDASGLDPDRLRALLVADAEAELAVRHGRTLAARLVAAEPSRDVLRAPPAALATRLELTGRGSLEQLALVEIAPTAPAVGQVRVAVRAAGLNFRDALNALGMVAAPSLGFELAGEVLEVGAGVSGFAVGDRVMGLGEWTFASECLADARGLTHVPTPLTFAEAAAVPLAFLTALYALRELAQLQPGERVLIHAAAGGVGMAAVQVAHWLGAEVYATASRHKWGAVRALGVAADHLASSRDAAFEQTFANATVGRGVDVVLNSLGGELVDASLRLLPRGGRFVEMGKTTLRDAGAVAAQYAQVTYRAFDLIEAGFDRLQVLLAEIGALLERGALRPLPVAAYDLRQAPAAFRQLANGHSVGKLVVEPPRDLDRDGAVLITGGVGELGQALARHLVATHGVRHLVLTSRRGLAAPAAAELSAELCAAGADSVVVRACDVADREQVEQLLASSARERPLTGVFHLAGVLDDGVIETLNAERLARVLRPKVDGALHLHELTRGQDLAAFVLFSSTAGLWTGAGQANYAAANCFLDALAAERRKQGLAAQSLAWGLWEPMGSGMTAHLGQAELLRIRRGGFTALSLARGMELLDASRARPEATLAPMQMDLATMTRFYAEGTVPSLLRVLIRPALRRVESAETTPSALRSRLAKLPEAERLGALRTMVQEIVATVMALPGPAAVPAHEPLKALGLDSLMAVEVRNQLSARAATPLPATLVFDYPSPDAIAKLLLSRAFAELVLVAPTPSAPRQASDEAIAIVGMACRAPGAVDPQSYWELFAEGRDVVGPFPERWDGEALYDPDPDALGKSYACEGGFLADVARFDANFFGIAPREALSMDPQQRLVLEVSWEALERAGIRPAQLRESSTGVYVGSVGSDYGSAQTLDALDGHFGTGRAASVLSGRVAYVLGLQGPALTVDTACSSSLVALHLACAGLRQGECDLALAGGVQVMSTPVVFVEFSRLRAMAPDGRCKSFAENADGAGWAEGCGMLVLKRLSDAERAGDHVLALVRGSAVNQDGRSQGLTAPNGPSQQRVIARALAAAGIGPADVDALEAHGTGTPLGDLVEAGALAAVFGPTRRDREPLYVGSSKSNLGHAQAAAGVLGVLKMVLALEHESLPKTLHIEQPNRHVDWEKSGLSLLREARPWPRQSGRARRAGVSSFGFSGTNAHLILEEAPRQAGSRTTAAAAPSLAIEATLSAGARTNTEATPGLAFEAALSAGARTNAEAAPSFALEATGADESAARSAGAASSALRQPAFAGRSASAWVPLLVTGRGDEALRAQAARWASWLEAHPQTDLSDVVHTALLGRTHFEARAALFVDDVAQAIDALRAVADDRPHADVALGQARELGEVVFVFPGQGSQWPAMGRALWAESQVFRETVLACDAALLPHTGWLVSRVLRGEAEDTLPGTRVDVVQPALFAMGVALAAVWRSLGFTPAAVVGTSQGEVAAAVVAGALSLEDGARVVALRSQLLVPLAGTGSMAMVERPVDEVERLLAAFGGALSVAGVNTPGSTIVSGDESAIATFVAQRAAEGVFCRRIDVDYASHSHHVEGLLGELAERLQGLCPRASDLPMVSTLTGGALAGPELDAGYWCRNLREPFRLDLALDVLKARGQNVFVEVSAHPVLALPLSAACVDGEGAVASTLSRGAGELRAFYRTLGGLYAQGASVPWELLVEGQGRCDLPTYAFQGERYWLEESRAHADLHALGLRAAEHPILRVSTPLADADGALFTGRLSRREHGFFADHRVFDRVLVPGTALVELALSAGSALDTPRLAELVLSAPVPLSERMDLCVQVSVDAADAQGQRAFRLHSAQGADESASAWQLHATGLLAPSAPTPTASLVEARGPAREQDVEARGSAQAPHAEWPPSEASAVDLTDFYTRLASRGLTYGPSFRGLRAAWRAGDTWFGEVSLPAELASAGAYEIHPALFDAALQVLLAAAGAEATEAVLLPYAWSEVTLHAQGARVLRVRVELSRAGDAREQEVDERAAASLWAFDEAGQLVLSVGRLEVRRVSLEQLRAAAPVQQVGDLYQLAWQRVVPSGAARFEQTVSLGGSGELAHRLGLPHVPNVEALEALLAQGEAAPARVLLDKTGWRGPSPERAEGRRACAELPALAEHATARALAELQTLLAEPRLAETAFVWITAGAVPCAADAEPQALAHAPLWGLLRSARSEFPDRVLRALDVTRSGWTSEELGPLLALDSESELMLRAGQAYGARLEALRPAVEAPQGAGLAAGTVLITGGLGELGQALARHLVEAHGVQRLLLLSRQGAATPSASALVCALEALGARADLAACDVGERSEVERAIAAIDPAAPLSAVFHLAGVLDDGVVTELNAERLARVLRPKLAGAWHLHEATRDHALAAFVLFSSVSGVIGGSGQANYAAANRFLDALASARRSQGLVAHSLAWGLWEPQGDGLTAHLGEAELARMRRAGIGPFSIATGMALLDQALERPEAELVPLRLETRVLARAFADAGSVPSLWRSLVRPARRRVELAAGEASALRRRLATLSESERRAAVLRLVQEVIAAVLSLAGPTAVPARRPLKELGIDSLMAVEVRNQLAARAETKLPATLVFDYPTPEAIATLLWSQVFGTLAGAAPAPSAPRQVRDEPIAIVGMACRTPGGVASPDEYYRLLDEGRDVVGPFPARWNVAELYDPDPDAQGKTYVCQGGFLQDVEQFDAGFFGIAPREARAMDPQQRLVLEVSWEALERAGVLPERLLGSSTGVYVGSMGSDYASGATLASLDGHLGTGQAASVLSGRVSYVLGLTGPAMTVDTACSSSLVALHLACTGLRQGECDLALAGGVQVMSTPAVFVEFSRLRGMAQDGRCKSFSDAADGAGWSEGCGMLVLKRLSDAQQHGDTVLAVLRGSAVNQDGRSQGLTAPNGPSQQRVILRALAASGLAPSDIDAVEAHGTGTPLGDPIEAGALAAVFGAAPRDGEPLYLGSSKSNLGHSQAAAGVLGVIKMVLALGHERLPKTLHAERPTTQIDWEASGLSLLAVAQPWPRRAAHTRRAGVSSFGISGTNAHLVVEEAPSTSTSTSAWSSAGSLPLLVSGRDEAALRAQALRWAGWLAANPAVVWADVVRTAAVHRTHFEQRAALLVPDANEAVQALRALAAARPHSAVITRKVASHAASEPPLVGMLFTGQGSQRLGMGRELHGAPGFEAFTRAFDEVVAACDVQLARPLKEIMWADPSSPEAELLTQTYYAQPALFALEVALYHQWQAWGVRPEVLLGHSVGELVAAHVAEVLSLSDAALLVCARGRLMQELATPAGAMASVQASAEEIEAWRSAAGAEFANLDIAGLNTPEQTVVSGDPDAVAALVGALREQGRKTTALTVSHAFHSAHMDAMLAAFREVAEGIGYAPPALAVVSNVTGKRADPAQGDLVTADYWVRHVRSTVRFVQGVESVLDAGAGALLECGPQGVLCALAADRCGPERELALLASLRKGQSEPAAMLAALAGLHVHGQTLPWEVLIEGRGRADLPTYAFQREPYWISNGLASASAGTAAAPSGIEAAARLGELYRLRFEPVELAADATAEFASRASTHTPWVGGDGTLAEHTPWVGGNGTLAEHVLVVGGDGALAELLGLASVADMDALGARLAAGARAPARVLFDKTNSGVAEPRAGGPADFAQTSAERLANTHEQTARALAELQLLLNDVRLADTSFVWVTRGALSSSPDEGVADLEHAPLWGLLRSARAEHPDRSLRAIDLDRSALGADELRGILALDAESELVWRAAKPLAPRFVGASLASAERTPPAAAAPLDVSLGRGTARFDRAGTVLITGGVGGLGQALARHLVERHGVRHLVLTSRRGDRAPEARELGSSLMQLGAQSVTVSACDVADRAALQRVLAAIDPTRPLTGVFHLAGVLDDGVVTDLSREQLERVMRPKVAGALHLHELTQGAALSAFVMFSSLAGVFGGVGQANYAAANTFLDALAAERRHAGLAGLSLAFGVWDAEQAGGMVAEVTQADRSRLARSGVLPLSTERALSLLDAAMSRPEALLVPVSWDLGRLREQLGAAREVPALLRALVQPSPRGADTRDAQAAELRARLARLPEDNRRAQVLSLVQEILASVLGLSGPHAVPADRAVKDLGLDSLMAVEARNRLAALVDKKLPAALLFDYPTPNALVTLLIDKLELKQAPSFRESEVRARLNALSMADLAELGWLDALMARPEAALARPDPRGPARDLEDLNQLDDAAVLAVLGDLLE